MRKGLATAVLIAKKDEVNEVSEVGQGDRPFLVKVVKKLPASLLQAIVNKHF